MVASNPLHLSIPKLGVLMTKLYRHQNWNFIAEIEMKMGGPVLRAIVKEPDAFTIYRLPYWASVKYYWKNKIGRVLDEGEFAYFIPAGENDD